MAEQHPANAESQKKDAVILKQELTITKRIGRGRLGVVYAGVHPILARRFAVKVLRPSLTRSDLVKSRLRHNIRDASQVEHSNIVSLVDFGQIPDGRFYITMDFIRGIPLSKVLERDGRFDVNRTIGLLLELCRGLAAAHTKHIAHGDLKPSNIMLVDDTRDGPEELRILDFRISTALCGQATDEDPLGYLRGYGGAEYLSPEQISGKNMDHRSDIYAFGCVAYRMLTGQPPFVGEIQEIIQAHKSIDAVPPSRRSGVKGVSSELDAIILQCLEKSPGDRFKTITDVQRALIALGKKSTQEVAAVSPFEEEEITGEWTVYEFGDDESNDMPLPESAGRLRQLFYDTIVQLADMVVEDDIATTEFIEQFDLLKTVRKEAAQLAAQVELAENRFEDIRRELREQESTLRYAIIDLNLAKSDKNSHQNAEDVDFQISELEQSLAELEEQRRLRFDNLNKELAEIRERHKEHEHQLALYYRQVYTGLVNTQKMVITKEAQHLYSQLERCRMALSVAPSADNDEA